jgi:hypothetical protein
MAHSKEKFKSNGDKASPYFKSFLIGKTKKRLLTRTLLYVLATKVGLDVV